MLGENKKTFLPTKRGISFLLLAFLISVVILSPYIASAFNGASIDVLGVGKLWESVGNLWKNLPLAMVGTIFGILTGISAFFADMAAAFLRWILSESFISLSYTDPARNPIIADGLNITQSFVNMILVLVLVFIALATILRLAGYETKKLLVTFIIVALLVNFAPVICGLIVDFANVTMGFLLGNSQTTGSVFLKRAGDTYDKIKIMQSVSVLVNNPEEMVNRVSQIFVLGIIYFFASLIYGLFALVFLARYIAIWLLVILSPIAFACYILPATKKYFSLWWSQFINWCIIGITCAFFLFLAERFAQIATPGVANPVITSQPSTAGGLANSILPHFVPLAMLGIGLIYGLQTGAAGATAIIGLGKRTGRWVGKKGTKGVGRFVQEKARLKEIAGRISKHVEKAPVARWFLPETLKKYGEFAPAIEKAQKEAASYSSIVNMDDVFSGVGPFGGPATGVRAAGKVFETIKRGDGQDIFQAAKRAYSDMDEKTTTDQEVLNDPRFQKKMRRILQIAQSGGLIHQFVRRDPRLASVLAGQKWAGKEYEGMSKEEAIERATSEARPKHINDWEREVLENETVVGTLMQQGGRRVWSAIENVKRGQETAQRTIDRIFTKSRKTNWDEFIKDFRKKHEGKMAYDDALGYTGFRAAGWKEGQAVAPGAPAPSLPGPAAGVRPPAGRRPGGGPAPAGRRPGGRGAPPSGRKA